MVGVTEALSEMEGVPVCDELPVMEGVGVEDGMASEMGTGEGLDSMLSR